MPGNEIWHVESDGGVMALFEKEEATALRELFAGMDAVDEARAASAMTKAAALLRKHEFSFRHVVQEINDRGLLLPAKIGAAMQLMDSTTLSEATSAFSGARRLMKNCGLTFAGVIAALDRQPVRDEDVEDLKLACKIEAERSRELEAEVHRLRMAVAAAAAAAVPPMPGSAVAPPVQPPSSGSSFGSFVVVAMLLLGVVLAASIVSTFSDMLHPANASITTPGATPFAATVTTRDGGLAPPRAGWNCWRNRGTQGPCF